VDGVFDMIHPGHYNALRQASKLGHILVVGVVSDEETLRAKGPTVFTAEERAFMIKECKWANEVQPNVPYTPTV